MSQYDPYKKGFDMFLSDIQKHEIDEAAHYMERLRRIESQAVKVINMPTWSGDDWYNEMCKLSDVLGEE